MRELFRCFRWSIKIDCLHILWYITPTMVIENGCTNTTCLIKCVHTTTATRHHLRDLHKLRFEWISKSYRRRRSSKSNAENLTRHVGNPNIIPTGWHWGPSKKWRNDNGEINANPVRVSSLIPGHRNSILIRIIYLRRRQPSKPEAPKWIEQPQEQGMQWIGLHCVHR